MAKVKGPTISMDAHGSLANAISFQGSKAGTIVTIQHKPRDPRTPAQLEKRDKMTLCHLTYCDMTDNELLTFEEAANEFAITKYNAWMKKCLQLDLQFFTVQITPIGSQAKVR